MSRDEAAEKITRAVYNDLGPSVIEYDCPGGGRGRYSLGSFDCTAFVERLNGGIGNGRYVNCSDCATITSRHSQMRWVAISGSPAWSRTSLSTTSWPSAQQSGRPLVAGARLTTTRLPGWVAAPKTTRSGTLTLQFRRRRRPDNGSPPADTSGQLGVRSDRRRSVPRPSLHPRRAASLQPGTRYPAHARTGRLDDEEVDAVDRLLILGFRFFGNEVPEARLERARHLEARQARNGTAVHVASRHRTGSRRCSGTRLRR